jgi:hypothetical protein
MRWTLAAALAAATAGSGWTAPAARAGDDCGRMPGFARVEVRRIVWRPAHYEDRIERVVVREGSWREEAVPATFGLRLDFGRRRLVRVVVSPAAVVRTWTPPVYGERVVRVLVPGRWDRACD